MKYRSSLFYLQANLQVWHRIKNYETYFLDLHYFKRSMIEIKLCKHFNQIQFEQLIGLMSQLCPQCPPLTSDHFYQIINHPTTELILAIEADQIIGSLTLAWYPIPTTTRAWIEDVVVDKNHRGQKIGEALVLYAIEEARKSGIKQIDLTSRPDRVEANKLYQKLGFQKRETNAYRLHLDSLPS